MGIKGKILSIVLAAALVPSAVSIMLIAANYRSVSAFTKDVRVYSAANTLKAAHISQANQSRKFLETGALADLALYNDAVDTFVSELDFLRDSEKDDETNIQLIALKNSFESQYAETHEAVRARLTGTDIASDSIDRAERIGKYMDIYLSSLMDRLLILGRDAYERRLSVSGTTITGILITLLVAAAVSSAFAVFMSGVIASPLRTLAAAAKRMAEGDLTQAVLPVRSNDEAGILTAAFNEMSAHIARYVAELKDKAVITKRLHREELKNERTKKLLKEAEFLALQSRIKPHFLFNTLNSIARDILLRGGKNAAMLVESLSSMLRRSLDETTGLSTVQKELETAREYCAIQQYRFGDRIQVVMGAAPDGADQTALPSFTLQPLIENAYIHGLEPKPEGGTLKVEVKREKGKIVLRVEDDGAGMTEDRLRAIVSGQPLRGSLGIRNVRDRLRLFTGKRGSFEISSGENHGTCVTIRIPEESDD